MIDASATIVDPLEHAVRVHVFEQAAVTGSVPQAHQIAEALGVSTSDVRAALQRLAAGKVIILAPNDGDIWAANPFCAVPSGFRVEANGTRFWGICIWDALGIVAALHASDAVVRAPCGDCGDLLEIEFRDGELVRSEGVIHFAVPARLWWENIGFA